MKYLSFVLLLTLSVEVLSYVGVKDDVTQEVDCLALNLYHEARDQGNTGLIAVAHVTLTRVKSHRFKDTYCSVIKAGYKPGRKDCHFSWYCDGKSDEPEELATYASIWYLARWFIFNHEYVVDPTGGATHYHRYTVRPWWITGMDFKGSVVDHLFYFEGY